MSLVSCHVVTVVSSRVTTQLCASYDIVAEAEEMKRLSTKDGLQGSRTTVPAKRKRLADYQEAKLKDRIKEYNRHLVR